MFQLLTLWALNVGCYPSSNGWEAKSHMPQVKRYCMSQLKVPCPHILGHKSNLSKFKKTEIISSIFSDHNAMRLDINYEEKNVKSTNTWRLNSKFLNNEHY